MSDSSSPRRETVIRAMHPAVEFRTADDLGPGYLGLLRVLFSPVNEWTEINSAWEGNFMERFAPRSWSKTIREQRDKIRALFQHGQDPQVGDKPLGPIRTLEESDQGGYGEIALLDTSYNRDLLPGLKDGLYGSSHRFAALREEWVDHPEASESNPKGLRERTIKEARLMEFGPVTFPAYEGATAGVRSMTDDFLQQAFRSDPGRLRAMFAQATDLRMDAEDMSLLAEMIGLGTTYLAEQDEADDAANVPQMEAVIASLTDLMAVEAKETEPDEPEEGGRSAHDAPSTTDAAADGTSGPERRVTQPHTSGFSLDQKEGPRWRLP